MSSMSTSSHVAPSFRGEMPSSGGGPKVYGGYGQGATDDQVAYAGSRGIGRGMRVRCVETGEVFASIRDAARAIGVDRGEASYAMACGKKIAGYTLAPADDPASESR